MKINIEARIMACGAIADKPIQKTVLLDDGHDPAIIFVPSCGKSP